VWITEQHTDHLGVTYDRTYLADDGADLDTALASYAVTLGAQITETEIAANLAQVLANGPAAVLTFNYSTQAQSIAAMARQAANLSRWESVQLAQFLLMLATNDLAAPVGMSADEVTALGVAVAGVNAGLDELKAAIGQIAAALVAG